MENAILDIQNVSVRFANGSAVQAVEQVSLSVFPRDKLCIIGETGSGKSILLLSVLRLLPASAVTGKACSPFRPSRWMAFAAVKSPMCRREAATA